MTRDISKILRNFTQLHRRKKVVVCLAAFVIFFMFYILILPTVISLFKLLPELNSLKEEIAKIKREISYIDNYKQRLRLLEEKLKRYEKRLSREKEVPIILENLSELAKISGVKIISIIPLGKDAGKRTASRTTGVKEKKIYYELPIAIRAQSTYHQAGEFINRLENGERFMQIEKLRITSDAANYKRHNLEFVIYAYTFRSEE